MHIIEALLDWVNLHNLTLLVILHIGFSAITSLHVLLYKESERTSLAWIGLVILSPFLGSLFYWLFGINRIKRLAKRSHPETLKQDFRQQESLKNLDHLPPHWHSAITAGYAVHPVNLVANNQITPLINGDTAYPAMLESIRQAKQHIVLSSYIFDYDALGKDFVDALSQAQQRGVLVQVLLDGVGVGYSWRKSDRALIKRGVKSARFLPAISLSGIRFINLRNHRKILCVDGEHAYIGGMNISKDNLVAEAKSPIDDVHFKVTGPVIDQISQIFIEDWFFATKERIQFPSYKSPSFKNPSYKNPSPQHGHHVVARVVQDGPDEYHDRIHWTLINALVCAQKSVKIVTPYFIPDQTLMTSLHAAALRGICVEIIIPKHNNIAIVDWVMAANFARIIEHGIHLYESTRPFDHSKIMIIDDLWSFIGSSNWDARSLEFNFEINLECFDNQLNAQLTEVFHHKKQQSEAVTQDKINHQSMPIKLRNNLARLFTPYL